jgi:hypothetical protein
MLEGSWHSATQAPKCVVVELTADEYRAIDAVCRGRCITAAELVRVIALRLAQASWGPDGPPPLFQTRLVLPRLNI